MRAGWRPGVDWERLVQQWYDWGRVDGLRGYPPTRNEGVAPDLARAYRDGYRMGEEERGRGGGRQF